MKYIFKINYKQLNINLIILHHGTNIEKYQRN